MSQKRQHEDGGSSPQETRKRVASSSNVVIQARRRRKLLANIIRRTVEVKGAQAAKHLPRKNQHCGNQIHPSASRSLQLQFTNKLSLPIFAGTKVEGDKSSPINVDLVDALTGQVVCDGLEPSVRVEIVVLEGDFEGGDDENWTFEDFKNNVVREREGKKPLLIGDMFFNLSEGTGVVGEFSFTDNSSWTRSRKFKLGARVADSYVGGIRVREAKTESFVVKDRRGKSIWWERYGYDCPALQKFAIRVLSLTCNATGCERNWSVFDKIHSKRRNCLEQKRLNALVFVKYNLQLEQRQIARRKKDNLDPICLSDLESDDEWITELEDPSLPQSEWAEVNECFTTQDLEATVRQPKKRRVYKKHYPPLLVDEVWRLEKIGKDGSFHKRLTSENINTVKDFLTLLSLDSQRLQNILGTSMSTKMWEATLDHARTCVLNNQTYVYYSNLQQKTGVVFNVIGELMGVLSEQRCISIKELPDSHKADANKLIRTAYEHWEDVVLLDEGASVSSSSNIPAISFPSDSFAHDNMYSSINNREGTSFVQHTDTSPAMISSVLSIGGIRSCDDSAFPHADNLEYRNELDSHHLLSGGIRSSYNVACVYADNLEYRNELDPHYCLSCADLNFCPDDHLQFLNFDCTTVENQNYSLDLPIDLCTEVSGLLDMSAIAAANNKWEWETLKVVVKCVLTVKRIVASKKSRKYEKENFG